MAVIVPRRREDFFDDRGEPTLRFVRWMEGVTQSANDTADIVDVDLSFQSYSAQSQWLQKQISGLPEFTIDTSGFTVDSSLITVDKVLA